MNLVHLVTYNNANLFAELEKSLLAINDLIYTHSYINCLIIKIPSFIETVYISLYINQGFTTFPGIIDASQVPNPWSI